MYILLTKKRIALIIAVLCLGFILAGQFLSVRASDIELPTNEKRVQYIATLGINLASDDFQKREVTIPYTFGSVYKKYNDLQRESGFDLQSYKGKEVTVFTYNIDNCTVVNLIIYKDKLIGGDIASLKIDGQMKGLKEKDNGKRTL